MSGSNYERGIQELYLTCKNDETAGYQFCEKIFSIVPKIGEAIVDAFSSGKELTEEMLQKAADEGFAECIGENAESAGMCEVLKDTAVEYFKLLADTLIEGANSMKHTAAQIIKSSADSDGFKANKSLILCMAAVFMITAGYMVLRRNRKAEAMRFNDLQCEEASEVKDKHREKKKIRDEKVSKGEKSCGNV